MFFVKDLAFYGMGGSAGNRIRGRNVEMRQVPQRGHQRSDMDQLYGYVSSLSLSLYQLYGDPIWPKEKDGDIWADGFLREGAGGLVKRPLSCGAGPATCSRLLGDRRAAKMGIYLYSCR